MIGESPRPYLFGRCHACIKPGVGQLRGRIPPHCPHSVRVRSPGSRAGNHRARAADHPRVHVRGPGRPHPARPGRGLRSGHPLVRGAQRPGEPARPAAGRPGHRPRGPGRGAAAPRPRPAHRAAGGPQVRCGLCPARPRAPGPADRADPRRHPAGLPDHRHRDVPGPVLGPAGPAAGRPRAARGMRRPVTRRPRRRRPGRTAVPGAPGLPHLHLGLDRDAQGRGRRAPRRGRLPPVDPPPQPGPRRERAVPRLGLLRRHRDRPLRTAGLRRADPARRSGERPADPRQAAGAPADLPQGHAQPAPPTAGPRSRVRTQWGAHARRRAADRGGPGRLAVPVPGHGRGQQLRPQRGGGRLHAVPGGARQPAPGRPAADRPPGLEHQRPAAGRRPATGRTGRGGRTLRRRARPGPRLLEPPRPHRRRLRPGPGRSPRVADVPHR